MDIEVATAAHAWFDIEVATGAIVVDPFYIVSSYINWVTTSCTYCKSWNMVSVWLDGRLRFQGSIFRLMKNITIKKVILDFAFSLVSIVLVFYTNKIHANFVSKMIFLANVI